MKKGEGIVQKKEANAVLFDLDGVLVDSLDAWFYVFNDALRHFALPELSKKEFMKDFGATIEHDIKRYFKGKTVKDIEQIYNACFKKRAIHVKLFPQSKSTLQKIKNKNIKTGLITNSTRFITLKILKHFKLTKYFDVIITMNDVKRGKPAPDMVIKALSMLKVKPRDAILVGDTKNDMLAGKRAGCFTVGYKINGDLKISSLNQILNLIENFEKII